MKLEFIGADHEVTGSCHYMEVGNKKFCIDIGMEQGQDMFENQEIPVNPSELDFILITHAHIDHTGLLPMLYARDSEDRCMQQRLHRISARLC